MRSFEDLNLTWLDEQRDEIYRELGRYVVRFSLLIATMRSSLESAIVGADAEREGSLLALAFGRLMAQDVAEPFFAMCRAVGDLDADELKVEKALREKINHEISERNRIAHGDWEIIEIGDKDNPPPATATLKRVRAGSPKRPVVIREVTLEELKKICDNLEELSEQVGMFAHLCREHGCEESPGEVVPRVRDLFYADGGQVLAR
jgi:hypothetical protein